MPSSIIELGSALLNIQNEAEYLKLKETHSTQLFNNAWDSLTDESQFLVLEVIKNNPSSTVQTIVKELIACETLVQLKIVKSSHPLDRVADAWDLIESYYPQDAQRIKEMSPTKPKQVSPNQNLIGEIENIKQEMNQLIALANQLNNRINKLTKQVYINQ